MPNEQMPRHERLRLRAFRMRVTQTELARQLLSDTGFSSVKSLATYIGSILRGDDTSNPMLDKVEHALDVIEDERTQAQAA